MIGDDIVREQLEFRVGSVLSRSVSIWLQNLIPFTLLATVVYAPLFLYTLQMTSRDLTVADITTWGLVVTVGGLVLDMIASAAMMYGVIEQLRGRRASMLECLRMGLKRLFPVLAVGVVAGICVIGGFIALIVPGIILSLMFAVAVPAAVVERPGIIASLTRSKALTHGYKLHIFGILFLLGALDRVIYKMVELILLGGDSPTMSDIKIYLLAMLGVATVLGALGAVVTAVMYHDLRVIKDGVSVDELVRVFE